MIIQAPRNILPEEMRLLAIAARDVVAIAEAEKTCPGREPRICGDGIADIPRASIRLTCEKVKTYFSTCCRSPTRSLQRLSYATLRFPVTAEREPRRMSNSHSSEQSPALSHQTERV